MFLGLNVQFANEQNVMHWSCILNEEFKFWKKTDVSLSCAIIKIKMVQMQLWLP